MARAMCPWSSVEVGQKYPKIKGETSRSTPTKKKKEECWQNSWWLNWEMQDNWFAYVRTSSRRNFHRFYGRAQKSWDQFDDCNSQKPHYVTQTFETATVHRLERFAQVILIRSNPMLQNLRIGLRKRQSGKSKEPAKQRGSWPKIS